MWHQQLLSEVIAKARGDQISVEQFTARETTGEAESEGDIFSWHLEGGTEMRW